jgi:hypothetical protein
MGSISAAKKIGLAARVATRVVAEQASRNRMAGALLSGARATVSSFGRVLHILWLEVTGFIFLTLAMTGAAAGVHEYHKFGAGPVNMNKVWAAALFATLFAYFGITSFWRARKKRA